MRAWWKDTSVVMSMVSIPRPLRGADGQRKWRLSLNRRALAER